MSKPSHVGATTKIFREKTVRKRKKSVRKCNLRKFSRFLFGFWIKPLSNYTMNWEGC
ncbi:hypothetical protein LEP1GSC071_0014 [Leptospira santarosai str. JET]|nr:hypothetical protein LEP1GSC071_0014 [Leptospira santarosai str. JET]